MSAPLRPTRATAVGVALIVTVLWSSSWILIRWGLDREDLSPLTFAALRYSLAALVVWGWMLLRERPPGLTRGIDRNTTLQIIGLGVLLYTVTQGAQFVAIDRQPAATTSLVLSLTPLLVAGLAAVSLAEFPTRRQILGSLLVVAGAWLFFADALAATVVGMVAALVALGANVGAGLLGREVNRRATVSPLKVTALSMAIGAALLLLVGLGAEGIPTVSARGWLIIAWLAVVNTALAFSLWNLSLQQLSALESAAINNTMLVQIAFLAWIFLDETPGVAAVVGILLVTVGVFLTQRVTDGTQNPRDP